MNLEFSRESIKLDPLHSKLGLLELSLDSGTTKKTEGCYVSLQSPSQHLELFSGSIFMDFWHSARSRPLP
jgi:hypothetical protein